MGKQKMIRIIDEANQNLTLGRGGLFWFLEAIFKQKEDLEMGISVWILWGRGFHLNQSEELKNEMKFKN